MDKPFVKLFKTVNAYYVFDVNKNEIIDIGEDSYKFLENILFDKKQDMEITEELALLKDNGYLKCESNVKEIRHIYTDYVETFLDRKICKITLQLTQNCNFRCKYCIYSNDHNQKQRNHSNEEMSYDTAKAAIDYVIKHSIDNDDEVNVGFYGGEPLLQFELIKKIISYCKEKYASKNITYSMTTNGSLLNDDIIYYLERNEISLLISLDGPKEINDINRVFANGCGTFDTVIKNIKRVKEIAPEYFRRVNISMVVDPKNDFDCINSICVLNDPINIDNLQSSIIDLDYDGGKLEFSENYTWKFMYQKFLAILSNYNIIQESNISPMAFNSIAKLVAKQDEISNCAELVHTDAPAGPCIPGQSRLFVDVHGNFFPCERVSEKTMCIGSIDTGFDMNKVKELLNVGQITEKKCINCWSFRYCTLCAKKADDGTGSLSASEKAKSCGDVMGATYNRFTNYLLNKEMQLFYLKEIRESIRK